MKAGPSDSEVASKIAADAMKEDGDVQTEDIMISELPDALPPIGSNSQDAITTETAAEIAPDKPDMAETTNNQAVADGIADGQEGTSAAIQAGEELGGQAPVLDPGPVDEPTEEAADKPAGELAAEAAIEPETKPENAPENAPETAPVSEEVAALDTARAKLATMGAEMVEKPAAAGWIIRLPASVGDRIATHELWANLDEAGAAVPSDPMVTFGDRELGRLSTLRQLQILDLGGASDISNFSPLAGLDSLEALNLSDSEWDANRALGLVTLSDLDKLRVLDLTNATGLADLGALAELTDLQSLTVTNGAVADIGPISGLRNLVFLDLARAGPIDDLGPLAGLERLETLNLYGLNSVTDLSPLAGLDKLTELSLMATEGVSDLGPLTGLGNLVSLNLVFAQGVTDLGPLAELGGLRTLMLGGTLNRLDLEPLGGLVELGTL
ncbi:MAG: hypothetical protein O7A03_07755, partial [Alphaproteobacteria bacterium]|nr:hypothetical protein [Alphaproteobacteria bacterium]